MLFSPANFNYLKYFEGSLPWFQIKGIEEFATEITWVELTTQGPWLGWWHETNACLVIFNQSIGNNKEWIISSKIAYQFVDYARNESWSFLWGHALRKKKKLLNCLTGDVRTCCIRFLKWIKMRRKFVLCFVSYNERTKEKLRNYFFV